MPQDEVMPQAKFTVEEVSKSFHEYLDKGAGAKGDVPRQTIIVVIQMLIFGIPACDVEKDYSRFIQFAGILQLHAGKFKLFLREYGFRNEPMDDVAQATSMLNVYVAFINKYPQNFRTILP